MSTKQPYKTYTRGQRIQDTNFVFSNGMRYTDAPLEEGFSKLLVNFDFDSNTGSLKPRKGLQTFGDLYEGYADQQYKELVVEDTLNDIDALTIVDGIKIIKNNKTYYQIIVGKITNKDTSENSDTAYTGDAYVLTCRKDKNENSSKLFVFYTQLNTESNKCRFFKPNTNTTSIHAVKLESSIYIKKHIGVFAFNNQYYYFCTDGKLYYTYFDESNSVFQVRVESVFKPYQSETSNSLYNMLLENPFSFETEEKGSILQLTGMMPTKTISDGTERTIINPKINRLYNYKLFYNYPEDSKDSYYMHISYTTENSDTVYTLPRDEKEVYTVGKNPFLFKDIQIDSPQAIFIVYAVKATKKEDATIDTNADATKFNENNQLTEEALRQAIIFHASFNYSNESEIDETTNSIEDDLVTYDLSYATSITYWKNRLWVFGAKNKITGYKDNTVLFSSGVNRPDWFPYPANVDIFDEDIVHLQPMLDTLLVFTSQNLYSITLNEDGMYWYKKHLQANLNINPWDYNLIQTVKNMVFFKSGNYYYMVVPKLTSTSGSGLAIAPVSTNIVSLLDNFEPNVKQIVDDLYNYSLKTRAGNKAKTLFDLSLIHYYNFLDFEDIHNCYVFECVKSTKASYSQLEKQTVYLNFELLYNTVNRTWRVYIIESERILQPLFKDATGKTTYTNLIRGDNKVHVQLLQYSNTSTEDSYIKQSDKKPSKPLILNNWQYLDTGNLDQSVDFKKRFREYQFKINHEIRGPLDFYSGFMVDKSVRTYEMQYISESITAEDSYNGIIVISAEPRSGLQGSPTIIPESEIDTEPDYSYTKLGSWKLGTSRFPEAKTWKIRIPTSGKGYLPRIILISYNTKPYELLSCSTVYRQLNSR